MARSELTAAAQPWAHVVDLAGSTSLHTVAARGEVEACSTLLGQLLLGEVNFRDIHGCTALHYAAEGGHLEVCSAILGHFIDAGAFDKEGCTALHCAAAHGHASVCQALLVHDLHDVASLVDVRNRWGQVALDVARGDAREILL